MKQAETQKAAADGAVTARLPETYQWLLVPVQATPQVAGHVAGAAADGQDALAVRASKKLQERRAVRHRSGRHAAAHGTGQDPAVARRPRRRQAARRRLCASYVYLPRASRLIRLALTPSAPGLPC